MNDLIIIDDCISKYNQEQILKTCCHGFFPWYFQSKSNYNEGLLSTGIYDTPAMQSLMKLKNCIDSPQLTHVLCSNDDPALSNAFKVFIPLLSALSDLDELIRIKLNLTYPVYTEAEYSTPHCDIFQIENHQTAIYYINDSDGDTVIFNEKYETNTTYDKLTIKQKITPKQGRLVIFNGMYLHAAGIPRNSECRMVANINFLAKNNA